MRIGFSLSSGGLLLPYHLGVLDCLKANRVLTDETPIAGASAGAIATASTACSIDSKLVLDDTIEISERCRDLGRARGNLLPLLRDRLEHRIDEDRFEALRSRPGGAVVTYHELFPYFRPVHQADFEHKEDVIEAVCHSSAFPFFSSDWPAAIDRRKTKRTDGGGGANKPTIITFGKHKYTLEMPRLVVDGHFAVPGDRFGCPDFDLAGVDGVDRTVLVTVFPREIVGLRKDLAPEDCICPELVGDGMRQSLDLLRLATQPCEPTEYVALYDAGYSDAEKWYQDEVRNDRCEFLAKIEDDRLLL